MITGITISFVSFGCKYNETVITSHKFENTMEKDNPDLEKYVEEVTNLLYSCEKVKFSTDEEVIVLRDIQKRNGFFKIKLDKDN